MKDHLSMNPGETPKDYQYHAVSDPWPTPPTNKPLDTLSYGFQRRTLVLDLDGQWATSYGAPVWFTPIWWKELS